MPWLIRGDHGVELVKFNSRGADKMVTGKRRSWGEGGGIREAQ